MLFKGAAGLSGAVVAVSFFVGLLSDHEHMVQLLPNRKAFLGCKLPWALPSSSSNVRTTVDLQPDCLPLGRLGNCHICICLARPFSSKELWAAGWPPACPVGVSFLCPGWLLYIGITLVRVRTSFVQFSVLTAHSQIMEEL